MTVTVSGSITSGEAMGRALRQASRRSIAQQLRRQGELAAAVAPRYANTVLKTRREGSRSRSGVHYDESFEVEYTGVDEFSQGNMTVSVTNSAPHARWLEVGTPGHTISPGDSETRLRWPPAPYGDPGPPWAFVGAKGASVEHPGFDGLHICQQVAVHAIIERLRGRTLGHARIRVNVR